MTKRFLIVDDSAGMRETLSQIVVELGHEVVGTAADGIDAITKYRTLQPDVITLDIIMPKMGGIESLRLIKKLDPKAVVLMVSARTDQTAVADCVKAGASHYLLKPFERDDVADVLGKVFPV